MLREDAVLVREHRVPSGRWWRQSSALMKFFSVVGPPSGRRPAARSAIRAWAAAPFGESVEHLLEQLRRQILVGVLADLDHRRIGAAGDAFHLFPGEVAVLGKVMRLRVDAFAAQLQQILGPAQHARRRPAHLDMRLAAHRRQLEHGVEGRDLVDPDVGHAEHVADSSGWPAPSASLPAPAPATAAGSPRTPACRADTWRWSPWPRPDSPA